MILELNEDVNDISNALNMERKYVLIHSKAKKTHLIAFE